MNWRISDSDFKYIEDEVKLYPLYKKRLQQAVNDMIYATPERDDNGGGKSNLPSRPVENAVFQLLNDTRILKLQNYVNAIEFAYNELDEEKQRFVRVLYWTGGDKPIEWICEDFSISQTTYLRWKKAFILRVGLITGDKRQG